MNITKQIYYNAKYQIKNLIWNQTFSKNTYYLQYKTHDWADTINPTLIQYLSNSKPREIDLKAYQYFPSNSSLKLNELYLMVGSTLQHADRKVTVWGSGLSRADLRFKQVPQKICAVRGPLTRDRVIAQGVDCPELCGDPLLLLPQFYRPPTSADYRLGIISHIADYPQSTLKALIQNREVIFINTSKLSVKEVSSLICQCRKVVSSSLHGLVLADAYEVPSGWIKNSQRSSEQDFKFHDYFASLGIYNEVPFVITAESSIQQLEDICKLRKVRIDLEVLASTCPFKI